METATGLTPQEKAFFEAFGYLRIKGLFARDIAEIIQGFEDVFTDEGHPRVETFEALHGRERRMIIPQFVTKSSRLSPLLDDPRVIGIVTSLLGPDYEYAESDGNLFDCESSWHSDMYNAPLRLQHVKVSFYLDTLRADSGAIRVIPGTQFFSESFGKTVRRKLHDPDRIEEEFGVAGHEIPSVALETDPGDVVVWDFRTVHASYGGGRRRRLFSINFREKQPDAATA
jgi:ectoine hydroxylase-related dioxygenase (phytanoyl-CoA dioxygenase family)